jgi:hypothetical protein
MVGVLKRSSREVQRVEFLLFSKMVFFLSFCLQIIALGGVWGVVAWYLSGGSF